MKKLLLRLLVSSVIGISFLPCQALFRKKYYSFFVDTLKQRAQHRIFDTFVQAFFPPKDRVKPLLCELIEEETDAIDVAMFQFTDKDIAQSLLEAYDRGVSLHLIIDKSCLAGHYNQALPLHTAGVPVFIHMGSERNSLMHNKIMILHSLYCVVTGSMNFTNAGANSNRENMLIIQDKSIFSIVSQ